jgi:hypothetical protein
VVWFVFEHGSDGLDDLCSDGTRVVGLGGVPDERVFVWDAATGARLPGAVAVLPGTCGSVSFDPLDKDQFVTSGMQGMFVWKVRVTKLVMTGLCPQCVRAPFCCR